MRTRRTWAAIAAAGATLATAVTIAQPATAASTFGCSTYPYGYVLAVGSGSTDTGALYSYPYSPMDKDVLGTFQTRTKIGTSGWQAYGAIRAGASGFLWALKSDNTISAYDWNVGATTWSRQRTIIAPPSGQTAPWSYYTTAAGKKRVAVDAKNQIFTLDSTGRVLKYAYSFASNSWTVWARPVAQLGTSYDMLWASDGTTLFARKTDGTLTRLRLDTTTDRMVYTSFNRGSGWHIFKNVFSAGGDSAFSVISTGGLRKYRFDEDTSTWPGGGITLSTSSTLWNGFLDTTAVGNTCTRTYPVPTASVPVENDVPLEALGSTTTGQIALAYSNASGELKYGLVDSAGLTQGSLATVNEGEASVGRAALTQTPDGLFHVFGHTPAGITSERTQTAPTLSTLTASVSHGGALTGHSDAVVLSNGTTLLAASDAQGGMWVRQQLGTQFSSWRQVATGVSPSAQVTVQTSQTNRAALYARSSSGSVLTTTVDSTGTTAPLVAPTDLGIPGSGATGRIAAMSYAGGAQRIAVTDTNGQVWTRAQDISTLAWAPTWSPVTAANGASVHGSPSLVLSPVSSRVQLVARRASDDQLVLASEAVQGSGSFTELSLILDSNGQPSADSRSLAADPTTFTYNDPDGSRRWGIVSYDVNRGLWGWFATADKTAQQQRGGASDPLELRRMGTLPR